MTTKRASIGPKEFDIFSPTGPDQADQWQPPVVQPGRITPAPETRPAPTAGAPVARARPRSTVVYLTEVEMRFLQDCKIKALETGVPVNASTIVRLAMERLMAAETPGSAVGAAARS